MCVWYIFFFIQLIWFVGFFQCLIRLYVTLDKHIGSTYTRPHYKRTHTHTLCTKTHTEHSFTQFLPPNATHCYTPYRFSIEFALTFAVRWVREFTRCHLNRIGALGKKKRKKNRTHRTNYFTIFTVLYRWDRNCRTIRLN